MLGLATLNAGDAHADTLTTTAYLSITANHGGNAALGSVRMEAWIIQLRSVFDNKVYGTVGRVRITDLGGNVQAIQINRNALGVLTGPAIFGQINDLDVHKDTSGCSIGTNPNCYIQNDTNDQTGDNWWGATNGSYGDPPIGNALVVADSVSVRWADGQLGTYNVGSQAAYTYHCGAEGNGLGNCGSEYETTAV
jgi:hypothetical protein